MITAQRHPLFYILGPLVVVLFCGFGSLIMYFSYDMLVSGEMERGLVLSPLFGIFFILLPLFGLRWFFKNSQRISIHNESINFGDRSYKLTDIKELKLKGKIPYLLLRFLYKMDMEGMSVKFNDGEIIYVYEDFYPDLWKIKSFLEKTIIEKQEYKIDEKPKISSSAIRHERIVEFKGNQLRSFHGILLWGFLAFVLYVIITIEAIPSFGNSLLFCMVPVFFVLLLSWSMHFFGLTKDHLVVQNHNLFWRQHIYLLANIKEIVFENPAGTNTLRVITKDYRTKYYHAITLKDKTWLRLKEQLEQKGVTVRNECIGK